MKALYIYIRFVLYDYKTNKLCNTTTTYKMKKRCVVLKPMKMQCACCFFFFFYSLARIDRTEETKRALHERYTDTRHPFLYMVLRVLLLYPYTKIKSSLYSRYYAEACNERRGPSPLLSAWATQLRRNFTTVASRWRHCADLTGPRIEPKTSRTDGVRLTAELTGRCSHVPPGEKELDCFTRKASKGRFLL